MQLLRRAVIVSLALSFLLALAGCDHPSFGYISIGEINRNPGSYEGREIKVRGTVTSVTKLPFVEAKTYTLKDDTGEIAVVTFGTLPPMGKTVAIKAAVKTAAILDGQSIGLRLEEIKQL